MKGARLIARVFATIFIMSLLSSGAFAQALPGRIATAPPPSSLAVSGMSSVGGTSDLLFGKGTTGPYTLSWKPIDKFSDFITIDGRSVQRDLDYDINYASGAITFKEPVSSDSAIRIGYSYDPSKAVQNAAPMSMPLKIDLLKKENVGLQFNALYKQSAQGGTSNPGMMVYGLTGNTKLKAGELNSMFLFSPDQSGQDDSSFGDRAAMSFGGTTKMNKLQLSTSYMRVGQQFAGAKDYNLKQGVETMNATATFTASPTLSISSSTNRTESLAGDKPNAVVTNQIAVNANPNNSLALQSNLTQKDSETDGKETDINLNVQAAPTSGLSVNAAISRVAAEKTGQANTESVNVTANPNQKLSVEMNVAHRDTDATGEELTHTVKVVSAPTSNVHLEVGLSGQNLDRPGDESAHVAKLSTTALKNTTVQVNWSQKDSELLGPENIGGVHVETAPFNNTKLGGGYTEIEKNGVVSRITDMSAATKPVSFLEFSGVYKQREQIGQDDLDSLNVALLLDTGNLLKFTGAYTTNPEDSTGIVQRANSQSVGLRSDLGRLKLKGLVTQRDEYLAGKRSQLTEIGVDYRLSAHSQLTTSYSLNEQEETSALETSVYTLGYTHKIASRLHIYLGGKMTTYERDQMALRDMEELQAEARIGLKF